MNNKGQTLIIFVILIPIIILIMALIVDVGSMTYSHEKYRGIVDDAIKAYYEKNDISALEKAMTLNGIEKENYTVETSDTSIEVILNTKIASIFGKIINIQEYAIKIDRIGKIEQGKVIIEKKE